MKFAGNGETKKEDLHIIHRIDRFHKWRLINYSSVCANQTDQPRSK